MPDKTIVITGASAGIGAAIARRLARDGCNIVLAARRADELQQVAEQAKRDGAPNAIVVPSDVTKRGDVEAIRDVAVRELGGFDVWINNAGRGITKTVLQLTSDDF